MILLFVLFNLCFGSPNSDIVIENVKSKVLGDSFWDGPPNRFSSNLVVWTQEPLEPSLLEKEFAKRKLNFRFVHFVFGKKCALFKNMDGSPSEGTMTVSKLREQLEIAKSVPGIRKLHVDLVDSRKDEL